MTDVFTSVDKWRTLRQHWALENKTIGFVPTMGNLHAGHQSLLQRAKQENEISVLSIFVNPTQFDNANDLAKYPRTFSQDFALAESLGVDYVLLPSYDELYADSYRYRITESKLSQSMEGQHRIGHFDGVLTVVMKLLMLVKSTQAYFGEKDFQQLQLVLNMTKAFFIDTKIVACPTVRDQNGLALSSRNSQLTIEQYQLAIQFPKLLASAKTLTEIRHDLEQLDFIVDYIEEFQGRRYGAVRLGTVRLIDNMIRQYR
jgi:pantoate--beta-alanine ligase